MLTKSKVLGCGGTCVVKRKSGFSVIAKVTNKACKLVSRVIIKGLSSYVERVKTLTYDNGKEFAGHIQIDQAARSFGERGSNENFNGLLSQYVLKKRSMATHQGWRISNWLSSTGPYSI